MKPVGRIHLARHGKPDLSRRVKLNRAGYTEWWAEYNRVSLVEGQTPPAKTQTMADGCAVFFASSAPRASETAEILASGQEILIDPVLVEAPLPAPWVPFKWRPPIWGTVSRIIWLMGYSAGDESKADARVRANQAADILIDAAVTKGADILLCGHGWFNRMIASQLRQRGWFRSQNGSDRYWAFRTYDPPI